VALASLRAVLRLEKKEAAPTGSQGIDNQFEIGQLAELAMVQTTVAEFPE